MLATTSNIDVKNYLQFCTIFGLTPKIKPSVPITCSRTSLIDHISGSLPERMEVSLGRYNKCWFIRPSTHLLQIYTIKTGDAHKKIKFCSLKNYAVDDRTYSIGHIQTSFKN